MAITYPTHREVDVALRRGGTLRVRPVRADDEPALRAFLAGLSESDRTTRFFSPAVNLDRAAREAADVDYRDRYGVVAVGPDGEILAHAMYVAAGDGSAEVAFEVAGALQGEGIATTMLAHLAQAARAAGVQRLIAEVLPYNHRMVGVFRASGLDPRVRAEPDVLELTMPTELSHHAREAYDLRDAEAAAAAVRRILAPEAVAVIGASDRPGSVGGAVLRNLLAGGFTGGVHAVNGHGGTVAGQKAHISILDVEGDVDLAVVAVPADAVIDTARECATKGVRGLVVLSAGFAEAGAEGRRRQEELVGVCRAAGMRLVGPNCLGVINTDPEVRLNASFSARQPPPGRVAFLSQSGTLGIALIEAADQLGVGLSSFVSVGDKADLSGNDFLSFWERDPRTDVVLLYLESFGNPRKFARVAPRVGRKKPIVAVKGGRSGAGARAAGSHTGALLAASDETVDALFQQAGVVRTDTLGELFDVAALLSAQPAPAGRRVGIVTNGGGLGILCADACEAAGLDVVATPPALQEQLRAQLPPEAAVGNPIDLLASAAPEQFAGAMDALARSGAVDALVVLYVPPVVTDPEAIASAVREATRRASIPVATVFAMPAAPAASEGLARFRFPEDAARALGRAARHGEWLRTPRGQVPELGADVGGAAAVLSRALARGPGWLSPADASELLDHWGIPQPRRAPAPDALAAAELARDWGVPVALKAVAPGLLHRSDIGAVAVGLDGPDAVSREADAMAARVRRAGYEPTGWLVQELAPPGVEILAGVATDPSFGPVVAVAAGGTAVELLRDAAIRLTPLTDRDAHDMVRELRTFPLLDGFRGAPHCDVGALEEILLRLGALVDAHHEVAELECNPLIVSPLGAFAVDVRVRVARPQPEAPEPSLRGRGG